MLHSYIETLYQLVEKLTSQNINSLDDILVAWNLTIQIIFAVLGPIGLLSVFLVIHVLGYRTMIRWTYVKCDGFTDCQLCGLTIGYAVFTLLFIVPFVAPVILYFI